MTEVIYNISKWSPEQVRAMKIAADEVRATVQIKYPLIAIVSDNFPHLFCSMAKELNTISTYGKKGRQIRRE